MVIICEEVENWKRDLICFTDIYLNSVSNVEEVFPNRNRSNGLHYVLDFDLKELRRLTIHERVRPLNGTQVFPLRFPANTNVPFRLATLNETIELLLGLNAATGQRRQLLIEIKKPEYHFQHNKSISAIVLNTLNAYNLTQPTDPIIIQTFHIEELLYIRRNLTSQLRLFALMTWNRINESSSNYDFYRSEPGIRYLSYFVQALAPDHQFVVDYHENGSILNSTNFTRWAHQYGLPVYPFTFRRDFFPGHSFEQLIEYFWHTVQVDGFITDHPNLVLDILRKETDQTTITVVYRSAAASTCFASAMVSLLTVTFIGRILDLSLLTI
jgi:glycerophosphoryl diester phosphodiesterase